MAGTSAIKVAATADGCCVRVEGRGTMRESPAAAAFAGKVLSEPGTSVVVDLSACDYLDSTFLGCLVEMHRRAGRATPSRLLIWGPNEVVHKLLGPTKLDMVLKTAAAAPQVVGEYVTLPAAEPGNPEVMRHVMECHRLLADVGGPQKAAFAAIADSIERELAGDGTAGKPVR